jgi:hypothetical protein
VLSYLKHKLVLSVHRGERIENGWELLGVELDVNLYSAVSGRVREASRGGIFDPEKFFGRKERNRCIG